MEIKSEVKPKYIVVNLNARVQPIHRGEIFEEPLDEFLLRKAIGEILGGGTLQLQTGEIKNCDIEIQVKYLNESTIDVIKQSLEKIGVPKGSKIIIEETESEMEIGILEGLAIYLNGTDLDEEIYLNCDSNHVYSELDRLTEGVGKVYSYWQGPSETAFYLYGSSYAKMKSLISELVDRYPLCQDCRIVQIV